MHYIINIVIDLLAAHEEQLVYLKRLMTMSELRDL